MKKWLIRCLTVLAMVCLIPGIVLNVKAADSIYTYCFVCTQQRNYEILEYIKFDLREFKQYVMNARSYMTNFYSESYLVNGIHIELYVVKREQNCESSFLFKIFVFYKNWDFLVEKEYNSPFDALGDSLNIIQWDEFSQEEKNEFEKVLKSTSHVNCVIRNLVWNFECSILGNSLKVYIVKS